MRIAVSLLTSFALSILVGAIGCFKLDDVFDCAALCDSRPHATTTCNGAGCVFQACESGYADCNGDLKDGCEIDLRNDPDNCGRCSWQCSAVDCTRGSCWPVETLVESTRFVTKMSLDESGLYFVRSRPFDQDAGSDAAEPNPMEADAGGGSTVLEKVDVVTGVRTTLASGLDYVRALAADLDAVYALVRPSGSRNAFDRVLEISKTAGTANLLATTEVTSARLVVDATNVYWGGNAASGVGYVAKTGGPLLNLLPPTLPDPAYDLSPVYDLALQEGLFEGLLVLASDGGLSKLPTTGGELAILWRGRHPFRVAIDATDVYFLTHDELTSTALLRKVPLAGGEAIDVWRQPADKKGFTGQALVSDDVSIYIALTDSVVRVTKATGSEVVLAGAQTCITDVAVNAASVYWSGCTGIWRLDKQHIAP